MSAECNVCGHDLAPDGIGLAPCELCALRKRVDCLSEALRVEVAHLERERDALPKHPKHGIEPGCQHRHMELQARIRALNSQDGET
jgi:hypothetical protein